MKKLLLVFMAAATQFAWSQLSITFPENATSYDFGKVEIGDTAEVTVTFKNTADEEIYVSLQNILDQVYPGLADGTTFCSNPDTAFNLSNVNGFYLSPNVSIIKRINFVPNAYAYQEFIGCAECKTAAKGTDCIESATDSLGIYSANFNFSYSYTAIFVKSVSQTVSVSVTGEGVKRAVGLQNELLANISMYPNPAKDVVHLSEGTKWTLRTMSGFEVAVGEGKEIDLTALNSGIYFVEFQGENTSFVQKIVKQ